MSLDRHTPKTRVVKRIVFIIGAIAITSIVMLAILGFKSLIGIPS